MALAYLAPLPIMIATLGWGLDAGAVAAAISIAGGSPVVAEPLSALVFAALGRRSRVGPWLRFRSRRSRDIFKPAEAGRTSRTPRSAPLFR